MVSVECIASLFGRGCWMSTVSHIRSPHPFFAHPFVALRLPYFWFVAASWQSAHRDCPIAAFFLPLLDQGVPWVVSDFVSYLWSFAIRKAIDAFVAKLRTRAFFTHAILFLAR